MCDSLIKSSGNVFFLSCKIIFIPESIFPVTTKLSATVLDIIIVIIFLIFTYLFNFFLYLLIYFIFNNKLFFVLDFCLKALISIFFSKFLPHKYFMRPVSRLHLLRFLAPRKK